MKRLLRDVARETVKKVELPQYEVKQVITAAQEAILDFMANGDDVLFGDLGIFRCRVTKAHMGRNPKTGESVSVPAMRRAHFKFFPDIKRMVKANRRGLDGEEKV